MLTIIHQEKFSHLTLYMCTNHSSIIFAQSHHPNETYNFMLTITNHDNKIFYEGTVAPY